MKQKKKTKIFIHNNMTQTYDNGINPLSLPSQLVQNVIDTIHDRGPYSVLLSRQDHIKEGVKVPSISIYFVEDLIKYTFLLDKQKIDNDTGLMLLRLLKHVKHPQGIMMTSRNSDDPSIMMSIKTFSHIIKSYSISKMMRTLISYDNSKASSHIKYQFYHQTKDTMYLPIILKWNGK